MLGWILLEVIVWLVVSWLVLVYITIPASMIAAGVGLLLGVAIAVIGYFRICVGLESEGLILHPGELGDRRPYAIYPTWDDGWPNYLAGQLYLDLISAASWPARIMQWTWARAWRMLPEDKEKVVIGWPLVIPIVTLLTGMTAGVVITWTAIAATVAAVGIVGGAVALAAIGVLRACDCAMQWWNRAAATCPRCTWVTRVPAYLCRNPRCRVVHSDIRSGRLGVWSRRCGCGHRLPATVLRASAVLTAVCPKCHQHLHDRAGVATDVRIAVSGGPGAGKTFLLMAGAAALNRGSALSTQAWDYADDSTERWLSYADTAVHGIAPPAEPVSTVTMQQGAGPGSIYLHLFDAAGALFLEEHEDRALWHLGTTRTHLFVLDPFTIPALRDRVDDRDCSDSNDRTSSDGPWSGYRGINVAAAERPYQLMVERIQRYGMSTKRCSLAIAITKADLLERVMPGAEAVPLDTSSRRLQEWLRRLNLSNLVLAADRDFHRVQFFLVGATSALLWYADARGSPVGDKPQAVGLLEQVDPAAPLLWLLANHPRQSGV